MKNENKEIIKISDIEQSFFDSDCYTVDLNDTKVFL